jgi:hypothetical protein
MNIENPDEFVFEMKKYILNAKNLICAIEEGLNHKNDKIKKLSLYMGVQFAECMNKFEEQKDDMELSIYQLMESIEKNHHIQH